MTRSGRCAYPASATDSASSMQSSLCGQSAPLAPATLARTRATRIAQEHQSVSTTTDPHPSCSLQTCHVQIYPVSSENPTRAISLARHSFALCHNQPTVCPHRPPPRPVRPSRHYPPPPAASLPNLLRPVPRHAISTRCPAPVHAPQAKQMPPSTPTHLYPLPLPLRTCLPPCLVALRITGLLTAFPLILDPDRPLSNRPCVRPPRSVRTHHHVLPTALCTAETFPWVASVLPWRQFPPPSCHLVRPQPGQPSILMHPHSHPQVVRPYLPS